MITYREALDQILDLPLALRRERVPLLESAGRILCEAVAAPWPLPRFDQSAMDGFALCVGEGVGPTFRVVGESAAGSPHVGNLQPGQAVRISTGARLPPGANAILPREMAEENAKGDVIAGERPIPERFIRRQGEDVAVGMELFPAGTRIDAAKLAFLSMFNLPDLPVFERPRVAILGSGNEVKPLGAPLGETDIVGSNLYYLMEELAAFGCETRLVGIARDEVEDYSRLLREAIEWGDAVISTAGVSVGDHDVVGRAMGQIEARVLFWRVAVRPGKPMMVAMAGEKPIFGLPGNPVSTVCNTEIFVKPFLRKRFDIAPVESPREMLPLAADCPRDRKRLFFIAARCQVKEGICRVHPLGGQSSGNLYNAARSNGLIVMEAGPNPVPCGELVPVMRITPGR